jgi:uncharacterized protein
MAQSTCTVAIIGAGPAGLVLYNRLSGLPNMTPLLFEAGPALDARVAALDTSMDTSTIINGAGGAGLFSDRKFSILPAGSGQLKGNTYELRKSYRAVLQALRHPDLLKLLDPVSALLEGSSEDVERASQAWGALQYKSVVLSSFEDARAVIGGLHPPPTDPRVFFNTRITTVQPLPDGRYSLTGDAAAVVDHVVYATGRFGAWGATGVPGAWALPMTPVRLELGVRILVEPGSLLESALLGMCGDMVPDPKVKLRLPVTINGQPVEAEFRTFCVCVKPQPERGYMVCSTDAVSGVVSWSGSSSFNELQQRGALACVAAGNNLGIMMRIKDADVIRRYHPQVMECGRGPAGSVRIDLAHPLASLGHLQQFLPQDLCAPFVQGLRRTLAVICKGYAVLLQPVTVYGPCIEGTGVYPASDAHTGQVVGRPNMWVVGDLTGHTRGLLQAMVGGDMLAKAIAAAHLDARLKACGVLQQYQSCFLPAFVYGKVVVSPEQDVDYCGLRGALAAAVQAYLRRTLEAGEPMEGVRDVGRALQEHAVRATGSVVGVVYELHHFFLDSATYGATGQLHHVSQHALIQYMVLCNVVHDCRALLAQVVVAQHPGSAVAAVLAATMLAHDFRSCFLSLRFRGAARAEYTDIPVMQSAYKVELKHGGQDTVATLACLLDGLFQHCIRQCGLSLQLVRTKVETQEPGVLPQPGCAPMYLECHVKVVMTAAGDANADVPYATKRALIQQLADLFEGDGAPAIFRYMSVSLNLLKHPVHGQQFFLTFRADTKEEMEFLRRHFTAIMRAAMGGRPAFAPYDLRFIPDAEFVVYDNNRDLDGGWFPTKQHFVHPDYVRAVRALDAKAACKAKQQ